MFFQILLILLFILPIVMVVRAWLVHRVMSGMLSISTIIAHLVISLVFLLTGHDRLLIMYLFACALAWVIFPHTGMAADRKARNRIRQEDIARYERRIQRNPELAAAHSALADAYLEAARLRDAIAAYDRAIELAPDHSRLDRWKRAQAVELLEQYEKQHPKAAARSEKPRA